MRYIDRCYYLEEQVACYAPRFCMVLDSVDWNEPNFLVLYPNVKLRCEKGQPRTTRLRNETKGQSINQGHCAISVGKKAIIEDHAPLELWLAPLVAKLNDPTLVFNLLQWIGWTVVFFF